jgi:hypothetical protein
MKEMKATTRDNILYLAIALGIVGILGLVAWYQDAHGLPVRMPISDRRFAFFFITAILFGYAIKAWRRSWHRFRFWVVLSLLFAIYAPLHLLLIRSVSLGLMTFGAIAAFELFTLLVVLEKFLPRQHIGSSSRNHP